METYKIFKLKGKIAQNNWTKPKVKAFVLPIYEKKIWCKHIKWHGGNTHESGYWEYTATAGATSLDCEWWLKCPTCGTDRNPWVREQEAKQKDKEFVATVEKGKRIESVRVNIFPAFHDAYGNNVSFGACDAYHRKEKR